MFFFSKNIGVINYFDFFSYTVCVLFAHQHYVDFILQNILFYLGIDFKGC